MTNEERQRAMDFIVEVEAKSSAKIDALAEAQKQGRERWREADERWRAADERWARTEESIRACSRSLKHMSRKSRPTPSRF